MFAEVGQASLGLKEKILHEPYRFNFFQLLYLLRRWQNAPMTPLGRLGPYPEERVRLRPDPSLAFSPADVRSLEVREDPHHPQGRELCDVVVNFMGLYGVSSPSPVYISELIGFTDVDEEPLTDFLDIFNHRILSLFYRAWSKYRFPYRYERGARDVYSSYAFSFAGLRLPEVRRHTHLPPPRLLKYIGLLAPLPRSAVNLRLMLADFLDIPNIRIRRWMSRWIKIPPASRNQIGLTNSRMGVDLTLGERAIDRMGKFRVVVGPLPFDQYLDLLPETAKFRLLSILCRLWVGERFDYDIEVIIRRQDIPEARLEGTHGARLGWTGWVTSSPGLAEDPSVVFPPFRPPISGREEAYS